MSNHKEKKEGEEGGGGQPRPSRIEGTVGALVGAAHLADTQDVERGGVEGFHVEFFRPQRLDEDSLAGSGEVCHRIIPAQNKKRCETELQYTTCITS